MVLITAIAFRDSIIIPGEKLATKLKGIVKVAYWDTEQGARPPRLIGQVKGTPTIKLFKPRGRGKPTKKAVVDYQYERKEPDMRKFALGHMRSFIEPLRDAKGIAAFEQKAADYGLPRVMVFSKGSKEKFTALVKYASAEFRARLLIGEVRATKKMKDVINAHGVKKFPHVVVLPPGGGDAVAYDKAGQAYRSPNTRAFEIFDFSTFYTRACRVPHTHQRGPQLTP